MQGIQAKKFWNISSYSIVQISQQKFQFFLWQAIEATKIENI